MRSYIYSFLQAARGNGVITPLCVLPAKRRVFKSINGLDAANHGAGFKIVTGLFGDLHLTFTRCQDRGFHFHGFYNRDHLPDAH